MEATRLGKSNHSNRIAEASTSVCPKPTLRSEVCARESYPPHKRRANCSNEQFQDSIRHRDSGCNPRMQAPSTSIGVSNCYVFKSRLQEYSQKVGLSTPTYETIREGPSHEPSFTSTVVVGGVRYDSLPGFFSRKAAEQSAAEIALKELSTSGLEKESISVPVHETGLCKNVLQEYAQKMNYAIPTYIFQNDNIPGRKPFYTCTVEMGGIQYIGAAASTKKEAEIKAARTALLAIQSSGVAQGELCNETNYAVIPCKRKVPETSSSKGKTAEPKKKKNHRLKNKRRKKNGAPPTGEGDMGPHVDAPQLNIGQQEASIRDGSKDALVRNTEDLKQVDLVNSDSGIGPGSPGHDPTVPITLFPGIDSVEKIPTENATLQLNTGQQEASIQDGGKDALVVNTEDSKQVDQVNSDSGIGPGSPGHDPTVPNTLFSGIDSVEQIPAESPGHDPTVPITLVPGIDSVEQIRTENANSLEKKAKSDVETMETEVHDISDIDVDMYALV